MASGRFITFEGGEGSGKSTQAQLLVDGLRARGIDALLTREPGGSPFAEQVRDADPRPGHRRRIRRCRRRCCSTRRAPITCDKTIRPALAVGRWVICDRFSDSTRVYQVRRRRACRSMCSTRWSRWW